MYCFFLLDHCSVNQWYELYMHVDTVAEWISIGGNDSEEFKESTVFRFHLSFTLNQLQSELGCSKF